MKTKKPQVERGFFALYIVVEFYSTTGFYLVDVHVSVDGVTYLV